MKVVYRLWPVAEPDFELRPSTAKSKILLLKISVAKGKPDDQARKHVIPAINNPDNQAAGVLDGRDDPVRLYEKCSLIYANARDA